jgi:coenzyme F420-0:L-glutamate ligase/coenzyme F420-1:gamma-L-glutamate ligase
MSLIINPVKNIPLLQEGDNLAAVILDGLEKEGLQLENNDILVITQKIISKVEGRYINLSKIQPSPKALELAAICEKDPRLVEVILSESISVLRCVKDVLIVEHRLGFICANAGVDHSNVGREEDSDNIWYLMLPKDPDASARKIREYIKEKKNVDIGILVIDSHGRAWRNGIAGTSIGTAGVPELVDMRGQPDLFGNDLRITIIAAADELAAAASLVMGQADEHIPVVHVRGFPYKLAEAGIKDVIRPKSKDLFR